MEFYLAAVINGILMGSVYGLTAVGLTLIFGVMKVINFAHGSFLMVSMFASYYLFALTGMDPYVGLIFVIPFCFGFGYFSQKFLIQPMFKMERGVREPMGVLLVTTGLMMVLDNLALLFFGADFKSAQTSYWGQSYRMGEIMISAPRLFAFFGMLIGSGALFFYLKKTTMGRAIRATGGRRQEAGRCMSGITLRGIERWPYRRRASAPLLVHRSHRASLGDIQGPSARAPCLGVHVS